MYIVVSHHCKACFERGWIGCTSATKESIFLCCKHVLTCLRFSQKYDNWNIDDWKRVISNDETKINRFNSDGRS